MRATIKFDLKQTGHPTLRALIEDLVDTFQADDLPLEYLTITEAQSKQLIEELSDGETVFARAFILQQFDEDQVDYKGVPIKLVYEVETQAGTLTFVKIVTITNSRHGTRFWRGYRWTFGSTIRKALSNSGSKGSIILTS